jgi:hypothetical protein
MYSRQKHRFLAPHPSKPKRVCWGPRDQKQQMQQVRQTTCAQMNAVFTPEQQQKLAEMKA